MIMNTYRITSLLGLSLLLGFLTGCNEAEVMQQVDKAEGKPFVLSGEIDQVPVTRANDSGFADGDAIGVYIVDYNGNNPGELAVIGNRASNARFTFAETAYQWNSDYDIYWKDNKTHIDVYGYYPYGNPTSISSYSFEVLKDQSKAAGDGLLGGYEASDFLWGKATDVAPTTNVVRLSFKHRMANVRVTMMEGTGFTSGEWAVLTKQALVLNTKQAATINLYDGSVVATGEVVTTGIIPSKVKEEFRAIVVPQIVPAAQPLFSVTVGGVAYKFTKEEAFTYISGKMHNFSITVNKKANTGDFEFVLSGESITAWENDLVSHDATAREYIVVDVPEAGSLKACIAKADKDYKKLQNLKITGQINTNDFTFMRDEMLSLRSLNLKEVSIKGSEDGVWKADMIPDWAFQQNKKILYIVLPDKLVAIGAGAFSNTSLIGSLIIPEGVVTIGSNAFDFCTNLDGVLVLPTTLESIGQMAFYQCSFVCELKLPANLKSIGVNAFTSCRGFYGKLVLPDRLEKLGDWVFFGCESLSGSLTIPSGINEIPDYAFGGCTNLTGNLILHDGITNVGKAAFSGTPFKGEIHIPQNLLVINEATFNGCDFSGNLKLPEKLNAIGPNAFCNNWRLTGTLEIPEKISSISSYAFINCGGIEKLVLPAGLESIQSSAFGGCNGLGFIVCNGTIPPYMQQNAFDGIVKDNITLEVPESSVQQYKAAPGWSEFKRITAHHELVCYPSFASAINTRCTRRLTIQAEGDWEVKSIPSWCTLSAMSGSKKTDLTLTFVAMSHGTGTRTEDIVFKLTGTDYTTSCTVTQCDYEYEENLIITLQNATKGKGVNLVFLGDGYNAEDVSTGRYISDIRGQVENFFSIEPYSTYRNYFNVYTGIALSPESGVGSMGTTRYTKFETISGNGDKLSANYDAIFDYALRMPTVTKSNLTQTLIVVTPNTTDYGGTCQLWPDGSAIAFCPKSINAYPYDTRGVLQHEAGGHGFGKLGDENISRNGFVDTSCESEIRKYQNLGWYQNLSLTGKMHEVSWSHFISHDRYSSFVDVFEGGYTYSRGVFRSEQNSCMNNYIPYYNTISREAIVKRIMEYAGEPYLFENFVANDKTNADF